ncbi:MAG: DEAD/DEAH box helicase [Verrucomicrobiales bacterium]|nr:DEAD/DEAH box helicase [Verrucomicrobiales bacterium]
MATEGTPISREVGGVFFGQFSELRPVQAAAIESLGAGRNVALSAGTGSGKTEAVVAPLVDRFRVEAIGEDITFLLYLCPTKALINDLARRLVPPLQRLGLRLAVRHGDRNDLDSGGTAHVLLTTPESFGILMVQRHPSLEKLTAVVVDEVHLLYNNQRGLMTAVLIHRLQRMLKHPIQVAALSATVGRLEDIRDFLIGDQAEAELLAFPGARTIDGDVRLVVDEIEVANLLERLMKVPRRKLLLFVNSRREAESLAAEIKSRAGLENLVATHHSSLSPEGRKSVESWFGESAKAVCISTSTLEMGIDIGDIDAVLLYGPPASVESLLQRIGRGNRRSNKTNVICLSRDEPGRIRETSIFSAMLGLAAKGLMPDQRPFRLFGAIAQQCLSIILREEGAFTKISDIAEEVGCRTDLDRTVVETILDELEVQEFIQRHGFKNRFGAADKLWELKEKNLIWGNFPLAGQSMDLEFSGRVMGSIPRANLMRLHRGAVFRFGGTRYRVASMVDQKLRITASPGKGGEVALIFGSIGPDGLDAFVANALWSWLFSVSKKDSFMTERYWKSVLETIDSIRVHVGKRDLPHTVTAGGIRYYTFAGLGVNRVILAWIGDDPKKADDISIETSKTIDWSSLPTSTSCLQNAAESCFAGSDRQTIFQQALPIELQKQEWIEEWLNNGDAERVLERLKSSKLVEVPKTLFQPLFS